MLDSANRRTRQHLEFDLARAPEVRDWLQGNELDDGNRCLIRRIVNEDGRSKAYINDRPVTLQSLQELAEQLVEIHGQHAHLTLLRADEQRRLLRSMQLWVEAMLELKAPARQPLRGHC